MDAACQCGKVAFKTPLKKPLALYLCHCDECRRQSGSAFGSSAIFPVFPLPSSWQEDVGVYSRPTASGTTLNCYFCKTCGTRVIHSTPGKDFLSVKGGSILSNLDWKNAHHIWTRRAVVPIPEGVLTSPEEPENEDFTAALNLINSSSIRANAKSAAAAKSSFSASNPSSSTLKSKAKSFFSSKPYNPEETQLTFADDQGKVYPGPGPGSGSGTGTDSGSGGSASGVGSGTKVPSLDDVLNLKRFSHGNGNGKGKEGGDELHG